MNFSSNRWVLLHHQVGERLGDRADHYDLMVSPVDSVPADSPPVSPARTDSGLENATLEDVSLLWTWAIPVNPLDHPLPLKCSTERLPDHRAIYLEYEGPISDQRGQVQRVASGTYQVVDYSENQIELHLQRSDAATSLHHGSFSVSLIQIGKGWTLKWSVSNSQTP